MSLKRIGFLLVKEFVRGSQGFIFIFAIVVPIVMSLVISLLFGTIFSGKPKLGISDSGDSKFTAQALDMESFIVRTYDTTDALRQATSTGAVDIGVTIPEDFDKMVISGETTEMTAYVWGESLLKSRAMLIAGMATWIREIAGHESPIDIQTTTLGETGLPSWEERLVPLVVVMGVMIGGVFLPATSLVDEVQKRTLTALTVTPTTIGDIYTSKALLGIVISTFSGTATLLLNRSFGINPLLLVFLLVLGAAMASEFGVLLGAFIKDINTLFATIKSMGIILYAPAIIYMFPGIPQWIAKIFPTYYMIRPIIEVTQKGAVWEDIVWMVYIQIGLIALLAVVLGIMAHRKREN
jgi:ABC-2 type transport system permease protein